MVPDALEDRGDLQAVLEGEVVRSRLVDDEADADDEVVAHAVSDRFVHHQPEAAAVLDRAAEAYRSRRLVAGERNCPMR